MVKRSGGTCTRACEHDPGDGPYSMRYLLGHRGADVLGMFPGGPARAFPEGEGAWAALAALTSGPAPLSEQDGPPWIHAFPPPGDTDA